MRGDRDGVKTENAILEYWNEIQTGGVTVGKWIRMLYEVIVTGLDEGRWFYDDHLAQNAVGFIQRYCHHYKGARCGKLSFREHLGFHFCYLFGVHR